MADPSKPRYTAKRHTCVSVRLVLAYRNCLDFVQRARAKLSISIINITNNRAKKIIFLKSILKTAQNQVFSTKKSPPPYGPHRKKSSNQHRSKGLQAQGSRQNHFFTTRRNKFLQLVPKAFESFPQSSIIQRAFVLNNGFTIFLNKEFGRTGFRQFRIAGMDCCPYIPRKSGTTFRTEIGKPYRILQLFGFRSLLFFDTHPEF